MSQCVYMNTGTGPTQQLFMDIDALTCLLHAAATGEKQRVRVTREDVGLLNRQNNYRTMFLNSERDSAAPSGARLARLPGLQPRAGKILVTWVPAARMSAACVTEFSVQKSPKT